MTCTIKEIAEPRVLRYVSLFLLHFNVCDFGCCIMLYGSSNLIQPLPVFEGSCGLFLVAAFVRRVCQLSIHDFSFWG